ncbi:MAG: AhpC/TSA family protein [Sphingobacteriaceae bacterium]|nr:AhpC/TSA family protein [Sphingobacteriaceae bacterium]
MKYLIIILFIFLTFNGFSQQKFTLQGTINIDTGTVELRYIGQRDYYPKNSQEMYASVKDGKFTFSGKIDIPTGYYLNYGNSYYSDNFVIQSGTQNVNIDVKANREMPQLDSEIMKEDIDYSLFRLDLTQKLASLDKKSDSLTILYKRKIPENIKLDLQKEYNLFDQMSDERLLAYVKKNQNSYFALWKLIYLVEFGYTKIFDSIFESFSNEIKYSSVGKILSTKLRANAEFSVGKIFTGVNPINIHKERFGEAEFSKHKYTLVDFWYSHCGPCRAQFDNLKQTYNRYKNKGFEIIGISTDKPKHKSDWLAAIKEHQLLWPQYWDIDGVEATNIGVYAFPTNFLVNEKGVIIKKNISTVELEDFLSKQTKTTF